ncbi:amidohydrolase family protein [Candidatus Curtissbacteria bacterium]|nr:amidohydrolase family protein [Candidatus Curtissbacteria bacterium]
MDTLIKLPGFVDVHVHLREPGATQKEDFSTGTKAAIAGGYTQVLDMPNNNPPTLDKAALDNKIKLATGKIWSDLGFNFGASENSTKYFDQVKKDVFGLKVYMNSTTGNLVITERKKLDLIFRSWQGPLPIMVHAENTLGIAISLAQKYKKKLHVCHMVADQIEMITKAKKSGLQITCEVCPHHLFLTRDDQKSLGTLAMMKPPLLTKAEQDKLWANINKIDMISTDHAHHTLEEKKDKRDVKFGVPGLETTLPLMLNAVFDGKLSLAKLINMLSTKARETFMLPEQPNTYVLVDLTKVYKIKDKKLFTKCNWTPFENMEGRGEIKKVVLRGKTVFSNGSFNTSPSGKIIKPRV